jgi:hypothetical protein
MDGVCMKLPDGTFDIPSLRFGGEEDEVQSETAIAFRKRAIQMRTTVAELKDAGFKVVRVKLVEVDT